MFSRAGTPNGGLKRLLARTRSVYPLVLGEVSRLVGVRIVPGLAGSVAAGEPHSRPFRRVPLGRAYHGNHICGSDLGTTCELYHSKARSLGQSGRSADSK
jgi:hypothetical protein